MKFAVAAIAIIVSSGVIRAQEQKPVPKDSVRVFIPGCTKGYVFTAGPRTVDQPGNTAIPEGTHLRMNAPKKTMAEIKGHEGSMIEISGLMKKNDLVPNGVGIGPVRIVGGASMSGGGPLPSPVANQIVIDVESWRRVPGNCPSR